MNFSLGDTVPVDICFIVLGRRRRRFLDERSVVQRNFDVHFVFLPRWMGPTQHLALQMMMFVLARRIPTRWKFVAGAVTLLERPNQINLSDLVSEYTDAGSPTILYNMVLLLQTRILALSWHTLCSSFLIRF